MSARNIGFALGGFTCGLIVAWLCFVLHPAPSNSSVSANVAQASADSPTFRVYLAGEVHRQGVVQVDMNRRVTVTQAIIMDGGLADFADGRRISLLRKRTDGTSLIIPVNFQRALSGRSADPVLKPGDLINVSQRTENF